MLYLNGVRFNTKNKKPDYEHSDLVKEFDSIIADSLKRYGTHVIIETKRRPFPDPKTGYYVYPGTRGLLLRTTRFDEGGNSEEWIYSEGTLGKKDGTDDLDLKVPNLLIEKGQYPIDIKRNPDLVFYAIKSGKVGRTEAESKKFHIRDDAARSMVNAEVRRLESKVGYMVYTAIPDPNLLILAKSWGIGDVDKKHIDEVRELLYNKVELGEKAKKSGSADQRGYKEFLEAADVKASDKVAALCVDAEEKGFLVYDTEQRSWLLNYKDGNIPLRLKELSGGEFGDPLGSLVTYLLQVPDSLRKVERLMNRKEIDPTDAPPDPNALTVEDIQKENNVPKLKKMIRDLDPDIETPKTMTGADAKEILFRLLAASATG